MKNLVGERGQNFLPPSQVNIHATNHGALATASAHCPLPDRPHRIERINILTSEAASRGLCNLAPPGAMGRKPNPLILEYFIRGPKLNDSSNRYPHTCKQCGENFPKGRIDSLTTHITKKCPAISDSDRMRACLELHGLTKPEFPTNHTHQPTDGSEQGLGVAQVSELPQGWSALETLAEASRQVDLNENNRVQTAQSTDSLLNPNPSSPTNADGNITDRFELQEQFTLDNPPVGFDSRTQTENGGQFVSSNPPCYH